MNQQFPEAPRIVWKAWSFCRLSLLWLALSALWTAILSIVLPEMADDFAQAGHPWGRGALLGLFSGLGATVSALTQILVGWSSDRSSSPWRRWKWMLWGFPSTLFPLLLLAKATTVGTVVLALVLLQITANMATGPYQALLPDEVPVSQHGLASTWMGLFQHAGQILGPLMAGILLGAHLVGLANLVAVLYSLILLGLLALWGVLSPLRSAAHSARSEPPRLGIVASLRQSIGQDANFQVLLQSRLIINVGFYLVVNFLLFYVRYSLGFRNDGEVTGYLLACMVGGGLLGGLVVGPRADRGRKVPLIYLTCAITALGLVGFVATPPGSFSVVAVFAVIAGFGFGGFSVVDWSLACNLAPKANSALSMGVWNLAAVLPQVIAPVLFGPASDALASEWGAAISYRLVMASVVVFLAVGSFRIRKLRES